jgi:hypothetical protein
MHSIRRIVSLARQLCNGFHMAEEEEEEEDQEIHGDKLH